MEEGSYRRHHKKQEVVDTAVSRSPVECLQQGAPVSVRGRLTKPGGAVRAPPPPHFAFSPCRSRSCESASGGREDAESGRGYVCTDSRSPWLPSSLSETRPGLVIGEVFQREMHRGRF